MDNSDSNNIVKRSSGLIEPEEKWLPIPGYEGLYEVSSFGRIKSLARCIIRKDGIKTRIQEKIMSQFLCPEGYYAIVLTANNGHPSRYGVHRLVGIAFVSGHSEERNHIDHIDGVKTNNHSYNLRWVTRVENMHNPVTVERINRARGRSVLCIGPTGVIKEYCNIKDVEEDGFNRHKVCACCSGSRFFHGGYVWVYKGDTIPNYKDCLDAKHRRLSDGAKNKKISHYEK